jgi:Flp pilus assembly pilin Flp
MNQRGYSFIEVALIIAIISVVTIMAVSNYRDWGFNYALKGDISKLKGYLEVARMTAIATGSPVAVALNQPVTGQYIMFLDGNRDGNCDDGEVVLDRTGRRLKSSCPSSGGPGTEALTSGVVLGTSTSIEFVNSGRRSLPVGLNTTSIDLRNMIGKSRQVNVTSFGEILSYSSGG